MVANRHQELTRRQPRDSNQRFSLGCTHTPPSGSPLSGSESDDDSGLEMWYVALTPMYQHETIMLESSLEEDVGSLAAPRNDNFYYVMTLLFLVSYLQFNY
jgi:hypothetical protein